MRELVSIITPTFNRAYILSGAIQSVLAQTYEEWELLIVDDGSTDDTERVVESFKDGRLKYWHQENKGQAAARNVGLNAAEGRWIAFLDSDNELLPNFLSEVIAAFAENHDKLCVIPQGHRTQELFEDGKLVQIIDAPEIPPPDVSNIASSIYMRDFIFDPTGFVHAASIRDERIRFDESMRRMEDWDYAMQIAQRHPNSFLYLPKVLYNYHQRYGGDGLVSNTSYGEWANIFEKIYKKHEHDPLMAGQTWYPQKVDKWRQIQADFEIGKAPSPHLYRFQ